MPPDLTLIGVPSSAGAHSVGQEKAPYHLRRAGFPEALETAGFRVHDRGDLPLALFRAGSPDRRQQNLGQVVRVAGRVADEVAAASARGSTPVVLGGDCTITVGVLAGLARADADLGLLYFDGDADLTTPATSGSGIFDSMGVAHMIGLEGAAPALARLGPRFPLLPEDRVALFGFHPNELGPVGQVVLDASAMLSYPVTGFAGRPAAAAAAALAELEARAGTVLVHFDVDVIDSGDFPLADYPHFNLGLTFDDAIECLRVFCASPKLAGLVLTEVNPDHDPEGTLVPRLAAQAVKALAGQREAAMA